jgi:hypothetical protein
MTTVRNGKFWSTGVCLLGLCRERQAKACTPNLPVGRRTWRGVAESLMPLTGSEPLKRIPKGERYHGTT